MLRERLKKNLKSEREKTRVAELKSLKAAAQVDGLKGNIRDLEQQLVDLDAKRQGQVAELETKNKHLQHIVSAASDG